MNLNLAQFLPSNLQALAVKIGLYILTAILIFSMGFYSGCSYKQNQWDADKLHAMERAKKQEQADTKAGARTVENYKSDQRKTEGAQAFIKTELGKTNPPKITKVVYSPVEQVAGTSTVDINKVEKANEDHQAILTADAMRLYDVSANPQDSELRARTYATTEEATVDEGFEKVILPNNLICADNYNQLVALQKRIFDKQQSFPDSVGQ